MNAEIGGQAASGETRPSVRRRRAFSHLDRDPASADAATSEEVKQRRAEVDELRGLIVEELADADARTASLP